MLRQASITIPAYCQHPGDVDQSTTNPQRAALTSYTWQRLLKGRRFRHRRAPGNWTWQSATVYQKDAAEV